MEESKVITEFRITTTVKERNELIAEEYNSCPLCGNELEFTHVTHFAHNTVSEEAFCYICNISAKKDDHKLQ